MGEASILYGWSQVGKINSSRSLLPGEKVIAFAFSTDTGLELERVELMPQGKELDQYRWPCHFTERINSKAKYMRAGIPGSDSTFTGKMSSDENKLWCKGKNVRLFTTVIDLDNWTEAETLRSAGDLSSDGTGGVEVQVQIAGAKTPCETLTFRPRVDRHQQYRWEMDLCRFINQNSLFIRAGEKTLDTQSFACIGSTYRNKFWVPVESQLTITYKIVVLEKIPIVNDWSEVGVISSARDVLPGEKVIAYAFANDTGVELENVKLPSLNQKYGQHKWPFDFAGLINGKAKYMRAGVRGVDGNFKGEWSGYKNKLWCKDQNVRVFTTIIDLDNWIEVETLRSAGDLSSDGTGGVEVQVQSNGAKKPCETLTFRPGVDRHQQYRWEIDLCRFINQNSLFIRAGEKTPETQSFAYIGSNSRNSFWVPVGSRLQVSYKIVALEKPAVANDWSEVGGISSARDVLPGEKIIAYAFANDTGVELENVKLPPLNQNHGQHKWPFDFAGLINRKAKYMRAGVRGADGNFKGEWSGYKNKLWCKDKNVRVFTTIIDLDNWIEVETLRSAGDLSSDGTGGVEVQIQSAGAKKPCETLTFRPATDRHQQYRWELDLCRYINQNSLFIRAGEKTSETQLFTCLGSSFANKFWAPVGSRLQVTYKIVVLEKIPVANDWSIVGKISSSRKVLSGEKVTAFAFSDDTGAELERVELPLQGKESARYRWPYDFAELINRKARYMRAGVQSSPGTFAGKMSGYENKLWGNDKKVRLFTTISDLDNWTEVTTLRSAGDLLADGQGSVQVQVQSTGAKQPCETLMFRPAVGRYGQYSWVADLCRYINQNSLFIRAGEKALETLSFACIGSNSRNKFWVPVGSGLQVKYQIIEAPVTKPTASLKMGDNDLLPDMTGFEPDRLGTADNSWFSPGYLLADRDLNDGEKLRAWLIKSADGKPVDFVEFTAAASNRSKAKWPEAFAKAINSKATQMRVGGWSDDGQFLALEKSETAAEFANGNLSSKAYTNRLWHYNDGVRAFTTAPFRTNWVQALSLDHAALNATETFLVQVRDITSQYLYETHLFSPNAKKTLSIKTLCEQVNSDAKMLRAGIWNTKTSLIAPDDKNNALWIPQCSDLAVTLMAVNWWSQAAVNATRDLQDGESIYCYVWDDFSSVELVPPLRFTPKSAAEHKKNTWLGAWATAIKASPLARYVRLGSSVSGSSDPGANATQAALWQIGAPLRVFTTEPSPSNWLSATGPLAALYENNKTSVKIELRNGLTQGLLQVITFTPSATVTKASEKELWLQEFYKYLVSQLVSSAYVRVGKTADTSGAEITNPVPVPMMVWLPRSSGIIVEVARVSAAVGSVAPVPGAAEMIDVNDLSYTFTAQVLERALVATVIAVGGNEKVRDNWYYEFLRARISPGLLESISEVFESKLKPVFNLDISQSEDWSNPFYKLLFHVFYQSLWGCDVGI